MIKIIIYIVLCSIFISFVSRIFIVRITRKYGSQSYKKNIPVRMAAEQTLHSSYPNVVINVREGETDRYLWKSHTLVLSSLAAESTRILGLAAVLHECGHAMIHQKHPGLYVFCSRMYLLLMRLTIPGLICVVSGLIMQLIWLYGIGMGSYCLLFLWDLIAVIYEECANRAARAAVSDNDLLSAQETAVFTKLSITIDLCAFPMIYSTILSLIKMIGLIVLGKHKPTVTQVKK